MITLRNIEKKDFAFIYELLKERPGYACISHKGMPTYEDHAAFCESNPYKKWYIIELGGIYHGAKAGSIYLTHTNEIGVSIDEDYQGNGLAKRAIKMLLEFEGTGRYLANIAPYNYKSKSLFAGMGFKKIQETFELEVK